MRAEKAQVLELILQDGGGAVRLACSPNLIPAPGQYLLASDGSDSSLPVPLFHTDSAPQGFIAAAPSRVSWNPGQQLFLRGPLGRGFGLPVAARRAGLIAFDGSTARLKGLIQPALKQGAAVVLVSGAAPDDLPDDVEIQPLSEVSDILKWADFLAFDVSRENLAQLKERAGKGNPVSARLGAQALIHTPLPCGGIGECGVCAITLQSDWKLACKDGPVFDWKEL
jgi:NAD(P)H-flavin reductase